MQSRPLCLQMGIASFTFINIRGLYAPVHVSAKLCLCTSSLELVLHIHTCMLYHVHGLHIHHVLISTPASMNSVFTFTIGSLRKGIACSFAAVALPAQYYKFSVSGSRTAIPNGNIHPRSVLK